MKKICIALLLTLFLVIAPINSADGIANTCIKIDPITQICLDSPLDPILPPIVISPTPTQNPPSKPPSTGGGTSSGGSSSGGSQSGSGGSKATSPRPSQLTPAQKKAIAEKKAKAKKKTKATPKPSPTTTEPAVENPKIEYKFETYPWYFWFTIIFAILGVGFLLFYDTDPDRENRSVIDNIKRRVLK